MKKKQRAKKQFKSSVQAVGALKFLSKEQTEKTGAFYEVEKKMTDLTDKLKEAAK